MNKRVRGSMKNLFDFIVFENEFGELDYCEYTTFLLIEMEWIMNSGFCPFSRVRRVTDTRIQYYNYEITGGLKQTDL